MKKKVSGIRRHLLEIKLGIFFLIAVILFFTAIISIKGIKFFQGYYTVKVKFKFAEGLKVASPVRFCGVNVGEIKKVKIKEEKGISIVFIYAGVKKGLRIPEGSKFFINNLGFFGEKYLEITPPGIPAGRYLKEDSVVRGIDSPPLFDVVTAFNNAALKIQDFVDDSSIKRNLESTLSNMDDASGELKNMLVDIKNKQGTVGKLLYDDSLYKKVNDLFEDLKRHPWKLLYKPREKKKKWWWW